MSLNSQVVRSTKRAHGPRIGYAVDKIAFPAAGELSVFNLRQSNMNAEHVWNLASLVLAFAAWGRLLRA
jgi:hypothetical protein